MKKYTSVQATGLQATDSEALHAGYRMIDNAAQAGAPSASYSRPELLHAES